MRIARVASGHGEEFALVDAEAGTWRRLGLTAGADWIDPQVLAQRSGHAAPPELIDPARLLPPVVPRCLVGVGLNFVGHAREQGLALPSEPRLFCKNPRSLAPPVGTLPLHPASPCLDYEAELGIVIGAAVFGCSRAEAEAAIAGWVVVQDYTLRDLARPETLAIAKGGPAMAPLGPWLTTVEAVPLASIGALTLRCRVNGELRQEASLADLHFGPVDLVRHVARYLPLGPGDVIAAGSPGGTGVGFDPPRWLTRGDIVETAIDGLGTLRQQVI